MPKEKKTITLYEVGYGRKNEPFLRKAVFNIGITYYTAVDNTGKCFRWADIKGRINQSRTVYRSAEEAINAKIEECQAQIESLESRIENINRFKSQAEELKANVENQA